MLITVFDYGTGDGVQVVDYLGATHDHNGELRAEVVTLRGNPRMTARIINSLTSKHRYSSGAVAWAPEDAPSRAEIDSVLDDIERTAFAGLMRDQYDWTCVLHRSAHGGVHVHFLIPRVELHASRSFNAFPPGWRKDFDALRDFWNFHKGWARPDDPARARPVQPGLMAPVTASQLRAGLNIEPDPRLSITDWLVNRVETGLVRDRTDVLASLAELGDINRAGADYISVRLTPGEKSIRLKGAVYVDTFSSKAFLAVRQATERSGTDPAPARRPDPEAAGSARRRLAEAVERRAAFNKKRFGTSSRRGRPATSGNVDSHSMASALAGGGNNLYDRTDADGRGHVDDISTRPACGGAESLGPSGHQSGRAAANDSSSSSSTATPKKVQVAHDRDRDLDRKLRHERDRRSRRAAYVGASACRASTLGRAQTLDGLHRVSSVSLVQIDDRPALLLQDDAPDRVVHHGAESVDRLRRTPPDVDGGGMGMTDAGIDLFVVLPAFTLTPVVDTGADNGSTSDTDVGSAALELSPAWTYDLRSTP
ncbi:MAG: hypothetical protein ABI702_03570 [Burkholderiales bacterium]